MFALARLRAALAALRCANIWTLPLRQVLGLAGALGSIRPVSAPSGIFTHVNCPPLGSPAFGRYVRGLERAARGERVPLVAHVSVTDRCRYRCARCSNIASGGPDPSLKALSALFGELKAAGGASVALTGGEPGMREDLPEIVRACAPELAPMLFTSGRPLNAGGAKELRSSGLVAAFVSLDHFSPEEHDRIRGLRGAHASALRAIDLFLAAGVYTAAQAVVEGPLLRNGAMEEFLDFCRGLGVHEVMLLEPVPVGPDSPCSPLDQPARDELARLHLRAARDAALPKVSAMSFLEGPRFLGCQAGFSFLYVTTGGEVFPCDLAPLSFGNVYEVGLREILARMARHIPRPSRKCLALRMRETAQERGVPIFWEDTHELLRGYDPGEPPELTKFLLPTAGRIR